MKSKVIATITLATIALMINMVTVMAASVIPTLYSDWNSGNAYDEAYRAGFGICPYAFKINEWGNSTFWPSGMDGTYKVWFNTTSGLVQPSEGPSSELNGDRHIANIIISNSNATHFDWELVDADNSDNVVYYMCAVVVKGGPSANVFNYTNVNLSDTQLYAPTNSRNNQPYNISHVTFVFCEKTIPPEEAYCYETAFAYGDSYVKPFTEYGFSNWGWTNGPIGEGTYVWDIYAGAGQNDLSKGLKVGNVTVTYYSNGTLTWEIKMDEGYILENETGYEEVHVYIGSEALPTFKYKRTTVQTVAPGQYPYIGSTGSVNNLSGDVYVIVHAIIGIPCV